MRFPRVLLSLAVAASAQAQTTVPASAPTTRATIDWNDPEVAAFMAAVRARKYFDVRAQQEAVLARHTGLAWAALNAAIPRYDDGEKEPYETALSLARAGLAEADARQATMLLWSAAASGNRRVVDALWDAGARPDPATVAAICPRDWDEIVAGKGDMLAHVVLLGYPAVQFQFRRCGFPLSTLQAAAIGDDDRMAELIAGGANVNDPPFASPLAIAAGRGHLSVVNQLLAAGARVTPDIMSGGRENWIQSGSPLQMAAAAGHVGIVRRLLDAGADPTQPTPRTQTQTIAAYLRDKQTRVPSAAHPNWPAILAMLDAAAAKRPTTRAVGP